MEVGTGFLREVAPLRKDETPVLDSREVPVEGLIFPSTVEASYPRFVEERPYYSGLREGLGVPF